MIKNYFSNLLRLVTEYGWLVGATLDDELVGAAIFLRGEGALHYHLSATNPDYRIPGVTNALLFKGIKLGLANKFYVLHLGGGNSNDPEDSLLKFKKKMGNNINKFFIGKRIHNSETYSQLKHSWEINYPELKEKFNSRLLCYRFVS